MSALGRVSPTPVRVSSDSDLANHKAPPSPTSTDGWGELENGIGEVDGEKDGWDDIEPLESTRPPPALTSIQAAQKRPVLQTKQASTSRLHNPVKDVEDEDEEDLWGSIAAAAPKTQKPVSAKPSSATAVNDDDPWAAIAAPPPTTAKASTTRVTDDDDPWAAIASPPPTTRVKPLSATRGRGAKAAAPRLGAQRINRASPSGT